MTDSTLYGASIPTGTSANTSASSCDVSLQITANSDCVLKGYRWWVPASGDTAGSNRTFRLFAMTSGTTGTLISAGTIAGAGTWTAEVWSETLLSTPVSLAAGTSYLLLASCVNDSRRYIHSWWASGAGSSGITSGPITAPAKASALGGQQQLFVSPSVGTFPGGTSDGEFFAFDAIVGSGSASNTASASLTVTPSLSAARVAGRVRSAALTLAVALSAAAGVTRPRTAPLTVSPVLSASPAAAHVRSASLTVSPSLSSSPAQVRGRGASLTVSPVLAAAARSGSHTRAASLTVSPVLHAAALYTPNGALIASWPDVERALGDFLAPLGTTGSETRPTLQTTLPYIRITRTGGSDDRVSDRANVSIDVFAANRSAAKETAGQVREYLLTRLSAQTDHGLLDWASTQTGPAVLPATDSDNLRLAVASYTVSMRRTAQ